jgi:hypothetical protein
LRFYFLKFFAIRLATCAALLPYSRADWPHAFSGSRGVLCDVAGQVLERAGIRLPLPSAFRFHMTLPAVLIFINRKEEDFG